MPDKYILIKASEATRDLTDLADSVVDMKMIRIPSAEVVNSDIELATINQDNWISSDNHSIEEGDITSLEIRVPKEAFQ